MPEVPSTALVTGAGSGIGRAVAIQLLQAGWRVALIGRTRAKLERALESASVRSDLALILEADLLDQAVPARLVEQTRAAFGSLGAVIHVAGDAPSLPVAQITNAIYRRCIDTNLGALVGLVAAAWPIFETQHAGCVVNVSSMASFDPFPGFGIYAPAKVASNMFIRCVHDEGAAIGVQAWCVAPGAVETPMLRGLFDETMIPPDKTLDPADVARGITDPLLGKTAIRGGETVQMPSP